MRRGEIWWARLGAPRGSMPAKRRPVLVVQSDAFNDSSIATVMAAVITSNLRLEAAPGNVRLSKRSSRLPKESVVNVSQVVTLNRGDLIEHAGSLAAETMATVDDGLRLSLSI